jgi:16S rRNA (adenine1518-N6/adenine1519-N6)-dimethyltransferase
LACFNRITCFVCFDYLVRPAASNNQKHTARFWLISMNINYNSGAALESLLKSEGLSMRKRFGQNFLINQDIRLRLADALDAQTGDVVWEIGPGLGAMTRILLDRKLAINAFEVDPGFIRILHTLFDNEKGFTLTEGDVLRTWKQQSPAPFLLGNLPYNIAAALIGDMTECRRFFKCMVITVQKEIALRMIATVGTEHYSSFSVLCNSVYRIKKIMTIHSSAFYPRPHVESCGVKLELLANHTQYPAVFYPLVRGLFLSRRKTIKNNLMAFLSASINRSSIGISCGGQIKNQRYFSEMCAYILADNSLTGNERAEDIDLKTFYRLAQTVEDMRILQ